MPDDFLPVTADEAGIARLIAARAVPGEVLIVGLTGSVAAGKTTLCAALKAHLDATHRVDAVSTDGFLLSNDVLAARGLTLRKGFPESYDSDALVATLRQARTATTTFPGYSHLSYDVDPARARTIAQPDIVLVEGLGLAALPVGREMAAGLDTLVYLDAAEGDLERWFLDRFIGYWKQAENDPASFYAQFRHMSEAGAEQFGRMVWAQINLPNLREHIYRACETADIVLRKGADHSLTLVRNEQTGR